MKKRIRGNKLLCLLLTIVIFVSSFVGMTGNVRADKLSDLKNQNEKDKGKLDDISEEIDELKEEQQGIKSEIDEVSDQISEIMASISLLEEEIVEKQGEIEQAKIDLEAAILTEEKQYEAMRIRAHFMYERGEMSYLELLLSAKSISDILNRADYIEKLYSYDRDTLDSYREAKALVEELKETLEIEEDELKASQDECKLEQQEMEAALNELKALSADYAVKLSKAQQQAKVYEQKIKKQNQEISKLEEEKRKAEEAKKRTPGAAKVNKDEILACKGSDLGKQIAIYACSFVGNKYVWGGTSLTNGTDCSGFTQSIYRGYGYSIPRTSFQQRSAGKAVEFADAQPGDLICYAGHVAMYIGNGKIVHARSAKLGIRIDYANYKNIICVRRIV